MKDKELKQLQFLNQLAKMEGSAITKTHVTDQAKLILSNTLSYCDKGDFNQAIDRMQWFNRSGLAD